MVLCQHHRRDRRLRFRSRRTPSRLFDPIRPWLTGNMLDDCAKSRESLDQHITVLIQSGRVVVPGRDGDVFNKLREQLVRAGRDQITQTTIDVGHRHGDMVEEMSDATRHVKPRAAVRDERESIVVTGAFPAGTAGGFTRANHR